MANTVDITIDSGATFLKIFSLKDINGDNLDLTGYTANSQIRKWYTSTNSISFDVTVNNSLGTVTLSLTSNTTSNIETGRYVYDVMLANSSFVDKIYQGYVTVIPQVTK